jgi:hypothetical protein
VALRESAAAWDHQPITHRAEGAIVDKKAKTPKKPKQTKKGSSTSSK